MPYNTPNPADEASTALASFFAINLSESPDRIRRIRECSMFQSFGDEESNG
jgi:hypothetical protein